MKKYFETKEVDMVADLADVKTTSGGPMVEVVFTDGTKRNTSKARFELLVSGELRDLTWEQNTIRQKVGSMMSSVLHEYDIVVGEVAGIVEAVVSSVNDGQAKASDILWGYDYSDIPLIEINKVLVKNENNNNGTASAGEGSDSEDQG
jgi:hypothetical protein